jgi:hypothetical protein
MKRTLLCFTGFAMLCTYAVNAQDKASAQVERGRQLFTQPAKGMACTTCHSMEGVGNAVGPDLKKLASIIGPRGLANTIQMTVTCYVQEVRLVNGRTFPGIEKQRDKGTVEIWDLSKVPATLVTVKESEIAALNANATWKHPPTETAYDAQELADIIDYLKFAATGVKKEVTPDELQ